MTPARITLFVLVIMVSDTALAATKQQEREAFLEADANGDRQLTKAEFKTFLKLLAEAGNSRAKRAVSFGELGYSSGFSTADANSNGLVTPAELRQLR
ncbi:MAG: EF-hand domain-containing protein [Pseudomonadota bacterium]